ncbi:MAG: ATP-binding protein [Chitinophagales bacterium]
MSENLLQNLQQFMAPRYSEGYVKGVHDQDAAKILDALQNLQSKIDLLRYEPNARACAALYWQVYEKEQDKKLLNSQLKGMGIIMQLFPNAKELGALQQKLKAEITAFLEETQLFELKIASQAAEYLFHELTRANDFIISQEAADLLRAFNDLLKSQAAEQKYVDSLAQLKGENTAQYELIRNWLWAYVNSNGHAHYGEYVNETARLLLLDDYKPEKVIAVSTKQTIEGLQGTHKVLESGGKYLLDFNAFSRKMRQYEQETVPLYEQFLQLKKQLTEQFRKDLRLEEFKPRVLSSFVRNQLIDKVYLPLIGDNLAKQIGVVGENKRTDLMGMLLLISPPGYGKTTLMEYITSRLGLIFMKINGPAIGHQVTSLDPQEAPNAAARQELKKLNLSFEMGDNVMIYLDDIQHCHPEFLQKFISLCDGQRKIEGVYKGHSKTYDLRGKKVCVVMAGNPYTESGEKFQIPDMLANRADTYNLGDIIGDSADLFKLSYIENCLTSNFILNRLAIKSHKDALVLIRAAETGSRENLDFEASHSPEEVKEYLNVLEKLLKVRDIVLKVNLQYIHSAAQEDQYRTEPPFKLQGSYRDMNKMAEKIMPVMNEKELQTLILSHYESESQTLTTGAEANLLKFKAINGLLSDVEQKRWEEIIQTFQRNTLLGGAGNADRMAQMVGQMSAIAKGLDDYSKAFVYGIDGIRKSLEDKN